MRIFGKIKILKTLSTHVLNVPLRYGYEYKARKAVGQRGLY